MKRYIHSTRVDAPLQAVSLFHQDSSALKRLTPPPVFVQMHQMQPLAEGSLADFTLWIGPIPVHWVASHHDVDPVQGFTDIQKYGPFSYWKHRHTFVPVDDGATNVIDEIEAEYGQGWFKGLVSRLMWWSLPALFAFRGWVTKRLTESGPSR